MKCPTCEAEVLQGQTICVKCGMDLTKSTAPVSPRVPTSPGGPRAAAGKAPSPAPPQRPWTPPPSVAGRPPSLTPATPTPLTGKPVTAAAQNESHELLLKAQQHRSRGEGQVAISYAEQAAVLAPNDPWPRVVLAELYLDLKDWERAEAYCEEALQLSPGFGKAIQLRARLRERQPRRRTPARDEAAPRSAPAAGVAHEAGSLARTGRTILLVAAGVAVLSVFLPWINAPIIGATGSPYQIVQAAAEAAELAGDPDADIYRYMWLGPLLPTILCLLLFVVPSLKWRGVLQSVMGATPFWLYLYSLIFVRPRMSEMDEVVAGLIQSSTSPGIGAILWFLAHVGLIVGAIFVLRDVAQDLGWGPIGRAYAWTGVVCALLYGGYYGYEHVYVPAVHGPVLVTATWQPGEEGLIPLPPEVKVQVKNVGRDPIAVCAEGVNFGPYENLPAQRRYRVGTYRAATEAEVCNGRGELVRRWFLFDVPYAEQIDPGKEATMTHALDDPAPDDPARLWVRVENADKSRVITCRVGGTGQQQGGRREGPSQPPENLDRALQDLLNRAREVQQQNPDLARRLLEQLLAQDPQNQEALRLLQQLGPVGLNQTPTPSQPNPSQVEQLLKEAGTLEYQASAALPNKAQAQQYLLQARQKYEAILSLDPGNAQARSGIDSVDVQMRTLQR